MMETINGLKIYLLFISPNFIFVKNLSYTFFLLIRSYNKFIIIIIMIVNNNGDSRVFNFKIR